LKSLTEIFGVVWASKNVLPKLLSLHVEPNYLHRLTPLFGMATLIPVVNIDVVRKMFIPVIITLATDPVPNIRMNVAKTIQTMYPYIKQNGDVEEKFK